MRMRSECYSTWSVCQSVCLSVYIRSRTTGYETAHEQYYRLKGNKSSKNNVADFAKSTAFKRYSVKTKRTSQLLISIDLPRPGSAHFVLHGCIRSYTKGDFTGSILIS